MKARKVDESTLKMVSHHVNIEDIYITHTIEQSDQSLDEVIEKRYALVLCGGGDGTAMRIIEQMYKKVQAHNKAGGDYQMPRLGILKLGTGNGWAGLLEVPPKVEPIWAIRGLRENELKFTQFNMIEADDRLCHFGGFGYDAMILNDYIELKAHFPEGFLHGVSNSLPGYLVTIFGYSIPKVLIRGFSMKVRITNNSDAPIYRMTHSKGAEEVGVSKGETIYEGRTTFIGAATTCNYGFQFVMYPFAVEKTGYMHLRVTSISSITTVLNLRRIWQGKYENLEMNDFLVKDVRVEIEKDAPFQLGGDPEGYRREVNLKVADFMVEMLDFRKM